jgi:hypothetical protein
VKTIDVGSGEAIVIGGTVLRVVAVDAETGEVTLSVAAQASHLHPKGKIMDGLSTEILGHSQLRTVPCCLCGVSWEERLVGVALVAGLAVLGDLCPRCLSREPADASARLKDLGAELRVSGPPEAAEERTDRPRLGGERLRWESRRIRGLSTEIMAANPRPYQEVGESWEAFLERLSVMGQWGTTVEQAIKAERLYFLRRFGPLDDLMLRRAVDYRYRDFLAGS